MAASMRGRRCIVSLIGTSEVVKGTEPTLLLFISNLLGDIVAADVHIFLSLGHFALRPKLAEGGELRVMIMFPQVSDKDTKTLCCCNTEGELKNEDRLK